MQAVRLIVARFLVLLATRRLASGQRLLVLAGKIDARALDGVAPRP